MSLLLRAFLKQVVQQGTLAVETASGLRFRVGDGTGEPLAIRLADKGAARQLVLNPGPHRHGVDPHRVAVQTGNEQFAPVFTFDERAETVGDLQSPPIVNFRR